MSQTDPIITAALAYAARGFYVFPLAPGSKIPLPGSNGHHDATTSPEAILAFPAGCNLGVDLERSGLVVLDVDVSAGKNGAEALREIDGELVPTLTQRTGRGGIHVFYTRGDAHAGRKTSIKTERFPGREKDKSDASGLDLFGKGYAVLPPSRLEGEALEGAAPGATGAYAWIRDVPIAPLPPVLIAHAAPSAPALVASDLTPRSPASPDVLRAAAARLERHGPAISGQGGNAHTRAAWGILTHDYALSEAEALALILPWNLTCDPPWDLSELRRGPCRSGQAFAGAYGALRDIVEGAGAVDDVLAEIGGDDDAGPFGGLGDLGEPPSPWEEALALARAEIVQALGVADAASRTPEPLFESAVTLLGKSFPRTPWLVRGLIVEGGVIILGGAPKTGKSWLLTELAIAVCSGTPAMGEYATGAPRTAAYFYAEDIAQSVQSHIAALAIGRGDPVDVLRNLHVQPRGRFLDVTKDDDCALIVASCRAIGKIDLLCLEPLRDLHSGEENDSDAMAPVMKRLRVIGEIIGKAQGSPCTVAVAHHSKKNTDATNARAGEGLRGSGAIFGSADAVIELMNPGGNGEDEITAHVKTTLRGARAAKPFDLVLKIADGPDGTAVRASYEVLTPKAAQAKAEIEDEDRISLIYAAIKNSTDQALSKNDICGVIGYRKQKAMNVIGDFVRRGVIVLTDRHPVHGGPMKPAKYRIGTRDDAPSEGSGE